MKIRTDVWFSVRRPFSSECTALALTRSNKMNFKVSMSLTPIMYRLFLQKYLLLSSTIACRLSFLSLQRHFFRCLPECHRFLFLTFHIWMTIAAVSGNSEPNDIQQRFPSRPFYLSLWAVQAAVGETRWNPDHQLTLHHYFVPIKTKTVSFIQPHVTVFCHFSMRYVSAWCCQM